MIYLPPNVYGYGYVELKTLSEFKSSKQLSQILYRLLQYIAEQDSISVSEICKKSSFSKTLKDRGNVRKYLRTLLDLRLINIDQEKTNITSENVSETKYYKLSAYGTYYLIEKDDKLPYELLKNLLKYQGDHLLFKVFLYPYITQDSLLKITDSVIFSKILIYLHECYDRIQETFHIINHTYNQRNGYLTNQLFVWQNVHDLSNDTKVLRDFLKQKFKLDWIDKAEIRKSDDENGITVSHGLESLLISLNKERTSATVSYRGKKYYEFIVRAGLGQYTVEVPIAAIEEFHVRIFQMSIQARIQELIFSLISSYGVASAAIRILSQDPKFKQALKDTKNQFDKRYYLLKPKKKI